MTEIIIALISALIGGGSTGLIAWKAYRKKADADAMKAVQEVYQQALSDQDTYIVKLRETRDHLINDREEMRRENDDLRKRLNDMDNKVRKLENDVAKNMRMVDSVRHFLCGRLTCQKRTSIDLGNNEDIADGDDQQ